MKTFHILIFGCQMNYVDSARIKAVLTHCGFSYVDDISKADIVIFDTCSVRQKAEDKVTGKLKTIKKNQKAWITGCIAEERVKKWKNVELYRKIEDTGKLPLMLEKLGYKVNYDGELIHEYENIVPEGLTSMHKHKSTAYVPISTGCNQFCAYCIVPYARGLEKYYPIDKIVKDVKGALRDGAKEIVLLGQIVNKHPHFVEIIKKVQRCKGLKRLRYTSPYPTYYSKELFALHEKEEKLCPHIHMPIQSGSDTVLKRMFRGYTVKQVKKWVDDIRKLKRNISITTDIIVGFPGETDEDFEQTLKIIKYMKPDMIYIGIYSPRPGTLGAKKYVDDISRKVKWERRNQLNNLLTEISFKNNKKEIGNVHEVLVHEKKHKQLVGVTDNGKQIVVTPPTPSKIEGAQVGRFVKVKVVGAAPFTLTGEIVS